MTDEDKTYNGKHGAVFYTIEWKEKVTKYRVNS